jgi:hypothetical protein
MQGTGKWIAGGLIGLVGVLALFLSAHAHGDGLYYAGLAVFILAVGVLFAMLKRHYDMIEGAEG